MSKRAWLNLAMLAAAVVLGLVAVFQPGIEQPAPSQKLTALKAAEIERIIIQRQGDDGVSLKRHPDGWRMTAPSAAAANEVRVEAVLKLAEAAVEAQFAAQNRDLAAYGLAAPAARVRLNDLEVVFGAATPLGGKRYVMVGATVYIVSDSHYAAIDEEVTAFVSRNLVPPGAKLVGINLPDRALRRTGAGQWSVNPAPPNVSGDAINRLVEAWREVQALRVEKYQNGKAQGAIVLHLEGGPATVRFQIIAREPELILARPDIGVQYHFSVEQTARLLHFVAPEPKPAPDK